VGFWYRQDQAGVSAIHLPPHREHEHSHEEGPDEALGGAPLDGERLIWWNFVSSSQERMDKARKDWKEGRFPKIPEDKVEFIPLPE
jgi:pirin-like protein